MQISTIILDLDGVILINAEIFSKRFARDFKVPLEKVNDFFNHEFQLCLTNKADLTEVFTPYLQQWHIKSTLSEIFNYWFAGESNLDQQLLNTIQNLRQLGIKIYGASNQEKYRTAYLKNTLGLNNSLDQIYTSADLQAKKPDRQFFTKLLERIGNPALSEILFWDDSQTNVDACNSLGVTSYFYSNYEKFLKDLNQHIQF